ncbi:hypothetical protein J6590_076840 [Homalodisca vitripennis]|nr:hypothetical protein J6590_076840 [Homalodisca vitripennis]
MLPPGSSTERCLTSSASVAPPCAGSWSSLRCVELERVVFVNQETGASIMPKFKKKPEGEGRGEWSEDAMKLAVAAVLENKYLAKKIKGISNNQENLKHQLGYFKATFEDEYEVNAPLEEFLQIAYDLAEKLNFKHRFNAEKIEGGKDFYGSFMNRHPESSYRKPQSTNFMRCVGFNKPQVESLWMRDNPGARINDYDIAKLVAEAYSQVYRLDIAVNRFRCTGVYPTNENIFSDLDFMGNDITNIPDQQPPQEIPEATAVNPSPSEHGLDTSWPNETALDNQNFPARATTVTSPKLYFGSVLTSSDPASPIGDNF